MSPDKLLKQLRTSADDLADDPRAHALVAALQRMDTWLSRGGALPKAWASRSTVKPTFVQRAPDELHRAVCQAAANLYNVSADTVRVEASTRRHAGVVQYRTRVQNKITHEVYLVSTIEACSMTEHLSKLLTSLNAARATK